MRNLGDVIKKMLEVVPEDDDLHPILTARAESVAYCPPENISMWWTEVADDVNCYFACADDITESWHKQLLRIWTDDETLFS